MANIHGTSHGDSLLGTAGDDVINGGRGNDLLYAYGNDIMTGGAGADIFHFGGGGGNDIITDFNPAAGDVIMYYAYTYLQPIANGALSDGYTFEVEPGEEGYSDIYGSVHAGDYNHDGIMDTLVSINDTNITIFGLAPSMIDGSSILIGG